MNNKNINLAIKTLKLLENNTLDKINFEKNFKEEKKNKVNTKKKILVNINNYFDFLLKKNLSSIEISSTKDMLFEVLMARFDILQLNRKSFIEIYKFLKKNPNYFIKLLPSFLESMIVTAELCNYNINGLKGTIRLKGLMLVYFVTFFQWMDDKNISLEKTMTELDKNLDQAEKFSKFFL